MSIPIPASCHVDLERGNMSHATSHYEKRLSDLEGLYADARAFEVLLAKGDDIVYDVSEFRPSDSAGDLIFGITRMNPGRVGQEFFLTRGHIHAKANRPEIYYGQKGQGLMQLEAPDGETRIVEIGPQTICYVPPYWIHRSINTGDEDLVMLFSYPADSGQDYGIIERSRGMAKRVFASSYDSTDNIADRGWILVDNPDYQPRGSEIQRSLMENSWVE